VNLVINKKFPNMHSETKNCQNCKKDFVIEPEDFDFYKKIDVPPPTFCPMCRFERRLLWRNEHNLYRAVDAISGKEIFSEFNKSVSAKIYEVEYWKSDAWDPMQYGRPYDFKRPFFEQFKELLYSVPWPSRSVQDLINSDYCAQAGHLKNCYLVFNSDTSENVSYAIRVFGCKDSFDILDGSHGELLYETTLFKDLYKVFFSYNCAESQNIWCSQDLVGCSSCVGCVGLRKKSYHIFNQPYTKEDYEQKIAELKLDTYRGVQRVVDRMRELALRRPVRFMNGALNERSTGDNLVHTKNAQECWGGNDMEDCKYCQMTYRGVKDSYDYCTWGDGSNRIYDSQTCGYQVTDLKFCFDCWPSCQRLEYAFFCRSSSDLFGCVSLKKKQYCILNKQYSKEEYEVLTAKIKKQMDELPYIDARGNRYAYGEFLPVDLCPYAYNESQLQSIFPVTKEVALSRGYRWAEVDIKEFTTTMSALDIPDRITDVQDVIVKELIACVSCKRAYRILVGELAFLKQQGIPAPRECLSCRSARRSSLINPPVFYNRQCAKCSAAIRTTYAPDRSEIVYCETCYQQEVV